MAHAHKHAQGCRSVFRVNGFFTSAESLRMILMANCRVMEAALVKTLDRKACHLVPFVLNIDTHFVECLVEHGQRCS